MGGGPTTSTGQNWITVDLGANTFGFVSGDTLQYLTTSPTASNHFGDRAVGSSTLTATPVPEPATFALLGLGLAGLA